MIFKFQYKAGTFMKFTPEAVKNMIDKRFKAKIGDKYVGEGIVLEAEIIDEGSSINFVVDWPEDIASIKLFEDKNRFGFQLE